ncbi:hypothetical protein ACFU51_17405 [Streptomyces sp. NPDC057430]|uniref:hypothetical protein n=1 Tax=unclassified Streptomyces TaxID=2593676 RepID=UPI0036A1B48A
MTSEGILFMSVRCAMKAYRRWGVGLLAAVLVLGVAGCGSDDEPPAGKSSASSMAPKSSGSKSPESAGSSEPLAVLKGPEGLELAISSAQRDAGGFLTIKGSLKNTSNSSAVVSSQTSGNETEVMKHGSSLGGATLVDFVAKKRYYVLRDTDGRPLTTTGISLLAAETSAEVFMQFPAPAEQTTEVTFQLPTFEPGTIKLS